jgi:hypothetical protein
MLSIILLNWDQAHYRLAAVGNHDLLTGLRSLHKLRQAIFSFKDIHLHRVSSKLSYIDSIIWLRLEVSLEVLSDRGI